MDKTFYGRPRMNPFFITGLPRSRTAWLANFFTYGPAFCGHDLLKSCRSLDMLEATLESFGTPFAGDSDSGLLVVADAVYRRWPEAKWIIVDRPGEDCLRSYVDHFAVEPYRNQRPPSTLQLVPLFRRLKTALSELLSSLPIENCLAVGFDGLGDEGAVRQLWKFILPDEPFPLARWQMLDAMRVNLIGSKITIETGAQDLAEFDRQALATKD